MPADSNIMTLKALSAVARLKEDADINYLIDFLRGSKSEKILEEHRHLKTYGAGADTGKQEWLNCVRDLISHGYLKQAGEMQALKLTDKSRTLLKSEVKMPAQPSVVSSVRKARKSIAEIGYEPDLHDELIKLRKYLARKEDVPAYLIVLDETIDELATYLPLTKEEIKKIKGFSDANTFKYASDFLKLVREYCAINQLASRIGLK